LNKEIALGGEERSKRSKKLVSVALAVGFVIVIAVGLVSYCFGYSSGYNSGYDSAIPVSAEQLVWSDEFSGTTIGPDWEHMIGDGSQYGIPGWGNNELQYYTDRPENSYVSGECLHIRALKEEYMGYNYTSARLRTKNRQDFLYGRIEGRMKLPTTKGMWPAFWMLPTDNTYGGWPSSGEIDIMEAFVWEDFPKRISGAIHYGQPYDYQPFRYPPEGQEPNQIDFSQDFHIYTLEWEPNEFRWYVDGNLYGTATEWYSSKGEYPAPFDQYFHILVNLAIGGHVPTPDESTIWPQELVIDYIRVYQIREPHDIAVTNVNPSSTQVVVGESVNITVEVENKGTETETFNVTVYYDTTKISAETVTNLAAGATKTLNFTWNTHGVAVGNYDIKAVAEPVTDETNFANNEKSAQVQVKEVRLGIPWTGIGIGVGMVVIITAYMLTRKKPA